MSAAPQPRQNIDIEEFERRLRMPEPKVPNDPLAELARLVGGTNKSDPLASLFGDPPAEHAGAQRREPTFDAQHPEPTFDAPADHGAAPHVQGDLRGSFDQAPVYEPHPQPAAFDEFAHFERAEAPPADGWDETAPVPEVVAAPPPPPARSRKPLYLTAAVIAAGFIGIGASLAWRGGPGATGETPTIKAASGPVKVHPPASQTAEAPGRDSALLDKTAATPQVRQVVTREEAPMDPAQAARSARIVSSGATEGATGAIPAQPGVAPQPPARPTATGFPEPKKVKTVAVRADGSIISSETTATAPQPPAKPAAPAPAAQSKNATPKSVARVATTPKVEEEAEPRAAAQRPAARPKAEAKAETPTRVARAETQDDAAPARASGGGFAVQLAAAGSEAEARQTAARLGQKYSEALGGRRPSFHKAADKDVYRVRVGGLSREAAVEACEKVKSAGGGCFVARN